MKYAILSDIHSNIESLQSVIKFLEPKNIDCYLCLGDIVGYGANPLECSDLIGALCPTIILGNHDAGTAGIMPLSHFNSYASDAIIWTKSRINKETAAFLKDLPLIYKEKDFTLVHGTLEEPQKFNYLIDMDSAKKSFDLMESDLLFVGHTHVPGVFEKNNKKVRYYFNNRVMLKKNRKYIVNAGSVGQPRDGDQRACVVLYDSKKKEIRFERVEYDIDSASSKIKKSGLSDKLADRIRTGM